MIICFRTFDINISRLFTFACLLTVFSIIQYKLILAVDAAPGTSKRTYPPLNRITTSRKTSIQTTTNRTDNCVAEIIDETLYFFSVGYRAISGALVVPITICAICGNTLVIYVIKHYRSLRVTGNVFLASLAVADVGVSTLAMTFYGLQLLYGRWLFGAFMCRLWFSCDVLFSTASIIHLACISLDRYLSIVRPFEYENSSSERRRYIMIFFCWFVSALLSFIPIFTGVYTTREQRHKIDCLNHVHGRCIFAVNQAYAIVSSSFSFWVPGAIMIIMYAMLIRIADRKEREAYEIMDAVAQRRRASQQNQYSTRRRSSEDQITIETTPMTQQLQRNHHLSTAMKTSNGHSNHLRRERKYDSLDTVTDRQASVDLHGSLIETRNTHMKHLRRERRAVKTLGSVMVAFIICWLPFFVRYTACEPNRCNWKIAPLIADIVFWVGYFNSMINPFLYAFHNRNFRTAFKKTLSRSFVCCRERRASTTSSIALPPATPSGESQRTSTNMRRLKKSNFIRSITSINERQIRNKNNLSRGKVLEASNGNLSGGENSSSSKRNSCL
ncbi:unnamed protein product [Rotaria sp. Silwood1]|nr:unnamed protein product [Rotaria sp. Silwood1]CAF1032929.1 unnamed protein product [Rotaria sp. Silwood1]CAF3391135.1 unnamed protein product [Rotaria sp. Silwood1]CAF3424877.1 unnamed protein product [Rotaria sp. Silwood1]CAF4609749.1 unnamed protein product [Rotaria sp. Silwood1]